MSLRNNLAVAALLLPLALLVSSCGATKQEGGEVSLRIGETSVSEDAGSQFIKVTAYTSWTLDLSETWAKVDKASGDGNASGITLSWEENTGAERTCDISLNCDGRKLNYTLTQARTTRHLVADTPGKWLELPATDDPDLSFITHDMTVSGKKIRNYSIYYDTRAKLSLWVAYPLNSSLKGSGTRTDKWGLDPKVPEAFQQVLYKSYSGPYDRGHQLPSADRLNKAANEATFYFTNMTPQSSELNQNAWGNLEGMVRNWSNKTDTLYVVTGADFKNSTETVGDNVGSRIPVPTGYFKALLGYKSDGFDGEGKYVGIAFYFENRKYEKSQSAIMKQSMSIDALEEKLGLDFFVNLPSAAGESEARKVESDVSAWWE